MASDYTDHRQYLAALNAARDEGVSIGVASVDDRLFVAFHRHLVAEVIEPLRAAVAGAEQATTDARRDLAEARETIAAADAYIKGRNELGDQTHAAVLRINADLAAVRNMLADCVVKATEYGTQDGDFVAMYLLPTGPIHRAIPYLDGVGINVRPGFDGRRPMAATTSTDRPSNQTNEGIEPCLCPPSPRSSSKSACKHSPRPTSSQETEPPSNSSRTPESSPNGSPASSLTPTALPESDAAAPQLQGAADVPAAPTLTGPPEALAQRFHEAYERLAPSFGYETREASAKPWADVPENNRRLMTAVCAEILAADVPAAADHTNACEARTALERIADEIPKLDGLDDERLAKGLEWIHQVATGALTGECTHGHYYLSTGCLHHLKGECGRAQHARGVPGHPTCKYCKAKCVCRCHTDGDGVCGPHARVHRDYCALEPDHMGWCGPNAGVPAAGEAEVTP